MSEKKAKNEDIMESLVSLCKRRGFVFQGSEIYGGLAGTWDYGPYGVALRNNIKSLWWKKFVTDRDDMYPIDASILMNPKVWEASGHLEGFADPLVECLACKQKFRVDHLPNFNEAEFQVKLKENRISITEIISSYLNETNRNLDTVENKQKKVRAIFSLLETESLTEEQKKPLRDLANRLIDECAKKIKECFEKLQIVKEFDETLEKSKEYIGFIARNYLNAFIKCPNCNSRNWNIPQHLNMMFKTHVGVMENVASISYLRPETAQGMFVNFKNILDTFHPKLPFGFAQIGKAFRNEIAPRDFIFRLRELEQMEIEYFVDPNDSEKIDEIFKSLHEEQLEFLKEIGLPSSKIHSVDVPASDRAHYSKKSVDTEFDFPFGQKELLGIAYRTDFDLKAHSESSGVDLSYYDEDTKKRFIPHCIEPTFGVDRLMLSVLSDAYTEDEIDGDKRVYLKLSPKVAPIKVAVFPLLKNKPQLVEKAREIYKMLKKEIPSAAFDDNGNIGKRYRRQDEIGTPYCVTVDFETLGEEGEGKKDTVTVRDRDSGKQERIKVEDLQNYLKEKI